MFRRAARIASFVFCAGLGWLIVAEVLERFVEILIGG